MINLLLAAIWLVLALGLLAWPWLTGGPPFKLKILDRQVWAVWPVLVVCAYNLIRWWSMWSYERQRRAQGIQQAVRARGHFRRREPPGEADPNFDFTSDPPPPPSNVTDQPPPAK
jgi:hypothetical protein